MEHTRTRGGGWVGEIFIVEKSPVHFPFRLKSEVNKDKQ